MGKRSISDDDIVRIFNTVKAMNPGPFKITDVVKDLKVEMASQGQRTSWLFCVSRE